MLISSSKSGQWIPSPRPIKRQRLRSLEVPCRRRGYQANGTKSVRPSARCTVRASSVTDTLSDATSPLSITKFMPTPQQLLLLVLDQLLKPADLAPGKTTTMPQPHLIKPELRSVVISLDVDMQWLVTVACIKEESVRTSPKHRRHVPSLSCIQQRTKIYKYPTALLDTWPDSSHGKQPIIHHIEGQPSRPYDLKLTRFSSGVSTGTVIHVTHQTLESSQSEAAASPLTPGPSPALGRGESRHWF
jgi:hypothetical protein